MNTIIAKNRNFKQTMNTQVSLMLFILLVISPVTTFCYNFFNFDYHILEPIIAFIVILILIFYSKISLKANKNFGEHIPKTNKILQSLSVITMFVFCFFDLIGNGKVLMSEITLVFVACVPIGIYVTISNRNRIVSHYNHNKYKELPMSWIVGLYVICLIVLVLLLGIQSNPYLLSVFSVLFSIPLFFLVLIGRELFLKKELK
jgi:hypothetical protein